MGFSCKVASGKTKRSFVIPTLNQLSDISFPDVNNINHLFNYKFPLNPS